MRQASAAFKAKAAVGKIPRLKADLYLSGGTEIEIPPEHIYSVQTICNQTSQEGTFDVGGIILSAFNFVLNNYGEDYSEVDFRGAKIIPYFFYDANDEVQVGEYYLNSHKGKDLITCEAYDALVLCDQDTISIFDFPMTAEELVDLIADRHGWTVVGDFNNSDMVLAPSGQITSESGAILTERQALAYMAQVTGNYCRMNYLGQLEIGWYDTDTTFTPAGILSGPELYTNETEVTGVKVGSHSSGTEDGLVVEIIDNPFVNDANEATIAAAVYSVIGGTSFRAGNLSILAYPLLEAGDCLDIQGETVIATTVRYRMSMAMDIVSSAPEEAEQSDLRTTAFDQTKKAMSEAVAASTAAESAQSSATAAQSTATAAQITANAASATAAEAQTTANAAAAAAQTTAQHFIWRENDGAYITSDDVQQGQAPTQNYIKLTSSGMEVVKSGTSMAMFGQSIRIGTDSKTKITIDSTNGLVMGNNAIVISPTGSASFTGRIDASGGTLGGWTLTSSTLTAKATRSGIERTTGLQVPSSGIWAIAVGATSSSSWVTAPFRVDHDGNVYCEQLTAAFRINDKTHVSIGRDISFITGDYVNGFNGVRFNSAGTVSEHMAEISMTDSLKVMIRSSNGVNISGINNSNVSVSGAIVSLTGNSLRLNPDVESPVYVNGTKLLYYSGDTETFQGHTGGTLTSSTKNIGFMIPMNKRRTSVNTPSPTITTLQMRVRHVGGGYLIGTSSGMANVVTNGNNVSPYTTTYNFYGGNLVIIVARETAYTATNNTPVSVEFSCSVKMK